jgi:hypothetical protein
VLDDFDPTSEWVEEFHLTEFVPNYDIDDLGWIGLDPDPLAGVGVALGMAYASMSHATHASTSTITTVADVPEESDESKDSELEDDLVGHAGDPISSNGDEFDD